VNPMDIVKEREIIKLWNRLRLLEREGRPTTAVRRQIEKALEHAA
jgi:cell division septal protein FtsQ